MKRGRDSLENRYITRSCGGLFLGCSSAGIGGRPVDEVCCALLQIVGRRGIGRSARPRRLRGEATRTGIGTDFNHEVF